MSNTYFKFKQFTIQQDKCAMKVTTDGCLFGAIAAKEISTAGSCKVLDIGAGTGLLSLMVTQQNSAIYIDAVELDELAARQASENVTASPWSDRIAILQSDILDYKPSGLYNVIISNPPFYQQQLSSPNKAKELAHHSSELTLQQLFQRVKKLLIKDGFFYVLLPFYRTEEAILLARNNDLFPLKEWRIHQTPKHFFFRSIICFSRKEMADKQSSELCIKDELQQYTVAFTALLQPFYLQL